MAVFIQKDGEDFSFRDQYFESNIYTKFYVGGPHFIFIFLEIDYSEM